MNIKSIILGKNSKRNKLNMSADVNSTFDFGVVQPIYTSMMMKGDNLSLNMKQLVRLAPMPTPSFARLAMHNKGVFVPWSDVFPAFDALLAHVNVTTSIQTYIPESVTCISPKLLLLLVLQKFSIYSARTITSTSGGVDVLSDTKLTDSQLDTAFDKFAKSGYGRIYSSQSSMLYFSKLYAKYDDLTSEQSDYVVRDVQNNYYHMFKLTNAGKRVVNILQGLGYALDLTNNDSVSMLPILAFFKSWFDVYAPKRFKTWSNTTAYKLINYVYENNAFDINAMCQTQSIYNTLIYDFMDELSECFVTTNDDFVSIHSRTPLNDASIGADGGANNFADMTVPSLNYADPSPSTVIEQRGNGQPVSMKNSQSSQSNISQYSLDMLKALSKFMNKHSVLGKRVDSILSSLYGASTSSEFFDPTKPLFDIVTNCSIDDVFNTTQNYTQGGDDLGSYAGRGIGSTNDKFSFNANSNGIFIILSSMVPQSSYFQGTAPYLYGLTRYTMPNPSFDALGLEVTPLACIYDNRGFYNSASVGGTLEFTGKGFGYIPRYSGFKIHRNIVQGDMAHRSTRESYEPYFLDKIMTPQQLISETDPSGSSAKSYGILKFDVPQVASEEFRYINKYDYMGDFNRLFYNHGVFGIQYENKPIYVHDDNFIVQSVIDATQTSVLKPIERSFDTFDEEVDDTTVSVQAQ